MTNKTYSSAQAAPSADSPADKSKNAPAVDRPAAQPDKAPAGSPASPKS